MRNLRPSCFKKVCMLIAVLFCSALIFAQPSDDWYYGKPIKSVSFTGLSAVKNSDVESIVNAFVSKPFDDEVFSDLINRIYALDFFEDITPQAIPGDSKYSTVVIKFDVVEKPFVTKLSIVGNHQVRNQELLETITVKEKEIFNKSKLLVDERALRDKYLEKGFTAIKVNSEYKEVQDGVEVFYYIDEGNATVINHIYFQGNNVVTSKTLQKKLTLKEAKFLTKGAFQESALETDKMAITAYYQNRGFIDAKVTDVIRSTSYNTEKGRQEMTLTFVISEGNQWNYGGINISGNKVFDTDTLVNLVKIRQGTIFNQAKFQEGILAISDLYFENGYTSNRFIPVEHKDLDSKVISYDLQIEENKRSHIESIVIKGNDKTKDFVILRELPVETGDIFSKKKITNGLRNLYNLQFFSAVVPDVMPGTEENLVELVLNVEEQSTTTLEFGLTFSGVTDPDQLPVSLYIKWQDSNLFGEGKQVSASGALSTNEQSVGVSYGSNWLWGLPISTSLSFNYSHSNNYALRNKYMQDGTYDDSSYYMQYEQNAFSLSASLGHRWTPNFAILTLAGGISGSLINNIYDSSLFIPIDYTVSQYNNNWAPKNSIYTSFSMDGRNVNYDASKGWFASQRFAWFGLVPQGVLSFIDPLWGETEFYLRSDTKGELYFTLFDHEFSENYSLKLVLMLYSGFAMQLPIPGSSIGDTNKLYIDGMFNGRGWSVYNTVKGMASWSNIAELRLPVVPGALSLDLFMDAVTVKKDVSALFSDLGNKNDWYFSFGPSLRFTIPQFPLRFIFANTFKFDDNGISFCDKYGNGGQEWWKNWNFVLSFNITNK